MAEVTTRKKAEQEVDKISKTAEINEAYFVGLCWADPFNNYSQYVNSLSQDEFIHDIWGFFFELGRRMYEDGVKAFDDITVHTKVKEYDLMEEFEEYDKMTQIDDTVNIVKGNVDNIEYYYETIKRNYTLKQLYLLFGEKVLIETKKYRFTKMSRDQLNIYWTDKVNAINTDTINNYEVEDLYIEADEFFKKLEEDSAEMLPYYKSKLFNSISQGIPRGVVTMFGGFGGTGKSSIMAEKFVMSCIENQEKMIIVLNEEDAQSFRQKVILSIMWNENGERINRKSMVNNTLTDEDKEKIRKAIKRWNELIGGKGKESLIKVIFMEKYIMKDLEKIVRFWANRNYTNLLIDTHKPSDESEHDTRWETFVEDMKLIYRMTRKNANGLNLRTVVTFQLADGAIRQKYLDFEAIGEGKKAKNEAGVMYMFRSAHADEKKGEKTKPLKCYRNVLNKKTNEWEKDYFYMEEDETYYLLFTPKNRFGESNDIGQPVLVIKPHFRMNHFEELGWCIVPNDKSHGR